MKQSIKIMGTVEVPEDTVVDHRWFYGELSLELLERIEKYNSYVNDNGLCGLSFDESSIAPFEFPPVSDERVDLLSDDDAEYDSDDPGYACEDPNVNPRLPVSYMELHVTDVGFYWSWCPEDDNVICTTPEFTPQYLRNAFNRE